MFREPALLLAHDRSNSQSKTFFAEQRITAVTGTERPDFMRLGKMHDVFVILVARPCDVFFARRQRCADRMQRRHKCAVVTQHVKHFPAHARHQFHVDGDVRRIGNLDADVRDVRTQRPHAERHYIHGAALHATIEQTTKCRFHFRRCHPIVGGAGVFLFLRADERAVFNTRHIGRIG